MCGKCIQLFLESHTVMLVLFDLNSPVCQLRHLLIETNLPGNKMRKKSSHSDSDMCEGHENRSYKVLKNSREYNIGQITLVKQTEWTPANMKRVSGARFKGKKF